MFLGAAKSSSKAGQEDVLLVLCGDWFLFAVHHGFGKNDKCLVTNTGGGERTECKHNLF